MQNIRNIIYPMIGNKQKNDEQTSNGLHNTLATGTTIKGNISTDTDFRLDGKVEGDILCQAKIVVGPKGNICGNIFSNNAEIHGNVTGSIKVTTKLVLKATATIQGDISAPNIEIEPNAIFNGKCTMTNDISLPENISIKQK